jgi:hypothetical protein
MDITGSVGYAAYGYYNNKYSLAGAFKSSTKSTSTGYNQLQGGPDHDGTYRMNTLKFKGSDNWTGKTSAGTSHTHSIPALTTTSAGTGTNDVDHIQLIPIIKY